MLTFTLVIVVFFNGPAVTAVSYYPNRTACEEAAVEAVAKGPKSQGFGKVPYVNAYCITGPIQK